MFYGAQGSAYVVAYPGPRALNVYPPPPPPGGPVPGEENVPGEDGGRARSAVEQAPGGSGPVAPGEAEDFMNVRAGADEMAGMMGGMGFGGGDE